MTETPDVGEPAPMIPVVIVDDSEDVRILIGARLQSSGRFTVVGEAGDGASAVNVVAATAPRLVVLDLSMPGMSGLEAIPLIRAAAPTAKVVVLSGYADASLIEAVLAAGAAGYVEKGLRTDFVRAF